MSDELDSHYNPCPCGQWRLDELSGCWEPTTGPASGTSATHNELPAPVREALDAALAEGFRFPVRSWKSLGDERHALFILNIECDHPVDAGVTEMHTYVVAADTHNNGGKPRLHHLSTAVHILQNVRSDEQWEIAGRDPDAEVNT